MTDGRGRVGRGRPLVLREPQEERRRASERERWRGREITPPAQG